MDGSTHLLRQSDSKGGVDQLSGVCQSDEESNGGGSGVEGQGRAGDAISSVTIVTW